MRCTLVNLLAPDWRIGGYGLSGKEIQSARRAEEKSARRAVSVMRSLLVGVGGAAAGGGLCLALIAALLIYILSDKNEK